MDRRNVLQSLLTGGLALSCSAATAAVSSRSSEPKFLVAVHLFVGNKSVEEVKSYAAEVGKELKSQNPNITFVVIPQRGCATDIDVYALDKDSDNLLDKTGNQILEALDKMTKIEGWNFNPDDKSLGFSVVDEDQQIDELQAEIAKLKADWDERENIIVEYHEQFVNGHDFEMSNKESELLSWQKYASYCHSCALSGEYNVKTYEDFLYIGVPGFSDAENTKLDSSGGEDLALPDGYRWLEDGEHHNVGDKFWSVSKRQWRIVNCDDNEQNPGLIYIRPLEIVDKIKGWKTSLGQATGKFLATR